MNNHKSYANAVASMISELDDNDDTYFYVQSFVVAESGEPVATYRWNGETQRYDEELA